MTNKTLGEMTDAEIGALVRAHRSGKKIERMDAFGEWTYCLPGWRMETAYRIAREPTRQAVIPWGVLADDIIAVAMDRDDEWYGYSGQPKPSEDRWSSEGICFSLKHIKFDRGNEPDWRNTLQMRPGHEVKE